MNNYVVTTRSSTSTWGTSIRSRFQAHNDDEALNTAKEKLRNWEDKDFTFVHARLYIYIFGVPLREVAYLLPEDWRQDGNGC